MNKDDIIKKLIDFRREFQECQSIVEFKKIEERLKRKLKEMYLDDDPFVKRCESSWDTSPSLLMPIEIRYW